MRFVTDEHAFWNLTDAAEAIFKYHRETPALFGEFDRGGVSTDGGAAYAQFSSVALSGWGNDELVISATKTTGGDWKVKHTIADGKGPPKGGPEHSPVRRSADE
jgi:hypothetical protein